NLCGEGEGSQSSGPYSQVCPCCHCDWNSTDALLGQEQDMVTESNSQASCYGAGT
ncbi:Os01g0234800, partial [Oryza sativa Japonica Group]